jgi:hypothetical protein
MRPGSAFNVESIVFSGVRLIRENGIAVAVEFLSGDSIVLPPFVAFGKVSLPVKAIEKLAFSVSPLQSIAIPSKVETLDSNCFY